MRFICKTCGLVEAVQDALLKDQEDGRNLSDNTDHATEIMYFWADFPPTVLQSNRSKNFYRTSWTYDSRFKKRRKKKWAAGVYRKDYLQWYRPWGHSTLVMSKICFKVPLTCTPGGPGTPCSPGTPDNPCKREGEVKELFPLRKVWFLQRLSLHRALSLLGAPTRTKESRIQMQYPNAQFSWATWLQNPLINPAHKLLPAKLCLANPIVLFSGTKAQTID